MLHEDSFDEAGARVLAAANAFVGSTGRQPFAVERIISRRFEPSQINAPTVTPTSFPELISGLREILGVRLVAYIGGVKSARSVATWAEGTGTPGEVDRERLRHAYHVTVLLRERYDATTVQSWFKGMNPLLDDDVPAHVLREGDPLKGARDVIAVAKAFANIA